MWSFLPFSFIPLPLIPHYYPLIVPFHQSNFSTSSPIIITLPSVWLSLFYKPSLSLSLFPPSHLLSFSFFSFQLPSIFLSLLFITMNHSKNHPLQKSKKQFLFGSGFYLLWFLWIWVIHSYLLWKKSSIKKKNPKNLILVLLILWAKMKFTSSGMLHLRLSLKLSKGDLWSLDGWLILNN